LKNRGRGKQTECGVIYLLRETNLVHESVYTPQCVISLGLRKPGGVQEFVNSQHF